jgi:anti-anti-sigma factor
MSENGFDIATESTGETTRVTVTGDLDLVTAPRLREHMGAQLEGRAEIILLDLAEVSFVDSTGLHALLDAAARDRDRLRVVPSPALLRLLDIAGLHDQLPIVDSR